MVWEDGKWIWEELERGIGYEYDQITQYEILKELIK